MGNRRMVNCLHQNAEKKRGGLWAWPRPNRDAAREKGRVSRKDIGFSAAAAAAAADAAAAAAADSHGFFYSPSFPTVIFSLESNVLSPKFTNFC